MKITFNLEKIQIPFSSSTLANLIFIDVKIHGIIIPLVFDTGATFTVMSSSLSSLAGAEAFGQVVRGGGNAGMILSAEKMTLDQLSIGPILVENLSVMVVPDENLVFSSEDTQEKFQIHGFIGWDLIQQFCWHIDMPHKTIGIEHPAKRLHSKENLLWDHMPIISITYEDDVLYFGLDTGNTETLLTYQAYFSKDHPYFIADHIQGLDGNITEDVMKLPSFSFDLDEIPYHLQHLSVLNRPLFPTDDVVIHGLFGMDLLKDSVLTLDFQNKHLEINSLIF